MKRRLFLGLMGAVGGAPKTMAKAIAPAGIDSLMVSGMASGIADVDGGVMGTAVDKQKRWKEILKQIAGISKKEDEFKMRAYFLHQLDTDTAALRSVSLQHKMKRSQRIQYYRNKKYREDKYHGLFAGWLKDEYY